MPSKKLQYLEIVGWDDYLHPDTTRRPDPPYRWLKLPTSHLDVLGYLTAREYGAFIRLLLVAATTGNRTPYKPEWIRRRSGVSRAAVETLSGLNLIRVVDGYPQSEKPEEKQGTRAKNASRALASDPQTSSKRPAYRVGQDIDITGESPPGAKSSNDPAPSLADIQLPEKFNGRQRARNGTEYRDQRSFDELKAAVLPVAKKLKCADPDELMKLAGQTLRMTRKQCATALRQLIDDGDLHDN